MRKLLVGTVRQLCVGIVPLFVLVGAIALGSPAAHAAPTALAGSGQTCVVHLTEVGSSSTTTCLRWATKGVSPQLFWDYCEDQSGVDLEIDSFQTGEYCFGYSGDGNHYLGLGDRGGPGDIFKVAYMYATHGESGWVRYYNSWGGNFFNWSGGTYGNTYDSYNSPFGNQGNYAEITQVYID